MELKDTVDLMLSGDWKDRFRAEYWQTKIRFEKLDKMISRYKAGTLDFKPNCSLDLIERQAEYMSCYIETLRTRATVEGINLGRTVSSNG